MKSLKKNYVKLGIIIFVTVVLTLSASNLYRNYDNNKINVSYISSYVNVINYNELSDTIREMSSNSFLYVGYTGNKEVYSFEKKLKKVIKNEQLEDNFYYVDVTEKLNDINMVDEFNSLVGIIDSETIIFPAVIYFKNNMPVDYVDSKNGIVDVSNVEVLFEKYELGKSYSNA